MISAEQIHEIAKSVMEQNYDYDNVGLRVQESDYGLVIGQQVDHLSRVWIDGDMTNEDLNGISAVSVKLAAKHKLSFGYYTGNIVLVLGSNSAEGGEDDGEIILKPAFGNNPVILDIISL